jgi:SAM-dependent MidA family methyltransferase
MAMLPFTLQEVNELAALLKREIESEGPIPFRRFMEAALYHPEFGYYTGPRDPFGRDGDFYTASQLQPVFGRLVRRAISALRDEMGAPGDFRVVEPGAGRGEMEPALRSFGYTGIDAARGVWPARFRGVVFANEFFDALPVDAARRTPSGYREMRVTWQDEHFAWNEGPELTGADLAYAETNAPEAEGAWFEIPRGAFEEAARIAASLEDGFVLAFDYGYSRRETIRFPRGTLMSYRRHRALDDVLAEPGKQDITAHVPFDALSDRFAAVGLRRLRIESMASFLLRAGERDEFAEALEAVSEEETRRLRLQLKTLLFGLGESFRAALWRKEGR